MTTNAQFHAVLLGAAAFFAADSAAVSVNTVDFGTIHRNDVARLLALTTKYAQQVVAQYAARVA